MERNVECLLENSKAAILSCIEIHNKPIFAYRYEVCILLCINSWELALKAFIINNFPKVRVVNEDGTTKPFEECVEFIASQLGGPFYATKENLLNLYNYRCNVVHFYIDKIDPLLFSLLSQNIVFYNQFSKEFFGLDLSQDVNLVLLPIGFKPFASPIDYLSVRSDLLKSSESVQNFVKALIASTEKLATAGIDEPIMIGFKMALENETRVKNADIIAGISSIEKEALIAVSNDLRNISFSNDPKAKKIRIEEKDIHGMYPLTYHDVRKIAKELFQDFSCNSSFNSIMGKIKSDQNYAYIRVMNMRNPKSQKQVFYSQNIVGYLSKYYKEKNVSE